MGEILDVTPASLSYLTLGGFVVAFSMISLLMKEKLFIGEVVLGTGFGVLIGPYCANIFNPRSWGSNSNVITLEVMRAVLATGLFAIGVELPRAYVAKHVKSLLMMVIPTMAFGWFICAGFVQLLFPNLNFVSSLVVSACLTPTDPVLASAIIGGKFAVKNVPSHIRLILAAESAANDGLAYPFLSISIYLTLEASKKVAIEKWLLIGWLYQVILGTTLGAFLGWTFSVLMRMAHRNHLIDRESFVAQYLSLAIFTIGVVSTLGSDDLLAAFAAGTAVSWDGHFKEHTEGEVFSSVIDLVLNCACFVYIGAWLPFDQYSNELLGITPWKLLLLFVAILALRRIPAILLIYKWTPDIHDWREALFCGHFGPMGVGAVFISTLAISRLSGGGDNQTNQEEHLVAMLHPLVSFVVLCSILTHGLSIPVYWFGREAATRTLTFTISRSRTSRTLGQPAQPDWLLWARRVPEVKGGVGEEAFVNRDVESGIASSSREGVQTASGSDAHAGSSIFSDSKKEQSANDSVERVDKVEGKGKGPSPGESMASVTPADASQAVVVLVGEPADMKGGGGHVVAVQKAVVEGDVPFHNKGHKPDKGLKLKETEMQDSMQVAVATGATSDINSTPLNDASMQQEERQVRFAQ